MTRVILLLLVTIFSMPALAQSLPNPSQVEAIEFNDSLANEPNTTPIIDPRPITEEIDTQSEIEGKAGLPQFDTSTFASQLFWLAISFCILYFFFARKILPSISSTLESRQSTIRNDLNQADTLSADVEKTRNDYEQLIASAKTDANSARAAVENAIREENEAQSAAFNDKSMKMITDIEAKAQQEQNRIKSDLEQTTVDLVDQIVGKLTDLNIDTATIKEAVNAELSINSSNQKAKKAA